MGNLINAQVLIVGGGPVGLTLAIDLAQRGVHVTVAEIRAGGEPPSVKCNHVAARTMEIFRRLGLVRGVRESGLPAEYPNDVAFRTTAIGMELSRIPIPCRAERYTAQGGPDTWWPTPEPPHRINQIYLEPVLFAHAAATPRLSILNHTQVVDLVQSDSGVRATAESLDGGGISEIFASYLIGCDGAHSDVRHIMGAKFTGDAVVMQTQSTYIRAAQLQGIIDEYNAGSSSADNYFAELVKFTKDLKEESERHIREELTENELEIFDILKKETMSHEETQRVRLAAKSLLHRLREERSNVLVTDWYKDGQSKSRVRSEVESVLDSHLPKSYDRMVFTEKCNNVFELMVNYASQGVKWTM